MPVEPPIEAPSSLADAYAVLAASSADAPITPEISTTPHLPTAQ